MIKSALPNPDDYAYVFELAERGKASLEPEHVLAKPFLGDVRNRALSEVMSRVLTFDRRVFLVRGSRDQLISRFLYGAYTISDA